MDAKRADELLWAYVEGDFALSLPAGEPANRVFEAMVARCREHYRTCLRFLDHPDPATRDLAARKALALIELAGELDPEGLAA